MVPVPTMSRTHAADLAGSDTARMGWQVCLGRGPYRGSGLIVRRERLRVIVAEPLSTDVGPDIGGRVLAMARTLLVAHTSAGQTARALAAAAVPPDSDTPAAPRLGVTVIDLCPDGRAEIACRYAPSILRAGPPGMLGVIPLPPASEPETVRLRQSERLVAFSASFLAALSPQVLAELPVTVMDHADPCTVWDLLAAGRDPARGNDDAADLAVISRSVGAVAADAAAPRRGFWSSLA